MVGMPYHLEKGPWLSVLEDFLNGEDERSYRFLLDLRRNRDDGSPLTRLPFFDTPALDVDTDSPDPLLRREHMDRDWFGGRDNSYGFVNATLSALPEELRDGLRAAGDWPETPTTGAEVIDFANAVKALVEETPGVQLDKWPRTGFWFQYYGEVENILRTTLIHAIEVSLGLAPGEELKGSPARRLPIEVFWKCPQRWFEGWVSWRWDSDHGTGQVSVMLATPGTGKPLIESPALDDAAVKDPTLRTSGDGAAPPSPGPNQAGPPQDPKGMWLITHAEHAQLPTVPRTGATASGEWGVPSFGPTYVGVGPVICVQPDEMDGGVAPFGRAWIEPPANKAAI